MLVLLLVSISLILVSPVLVSVPVTGLVSVWIRDVFCVVFTSVVKGLCILAVVTVSVTVTVVLSYYVVISD